MHPWLPIANWLGLPDGWIVGIAATAASGLGWLVKHVTSRSAERAAALNAAVQQKDASNTTMQGKALDTLGALIERLQADLARQEQRTERIENEYGKRLEKLERRAGRMNNFIVRLLDCYLQIKAYVSVLEGIVTTNRPDWPRRQWPDIGLPNFDEETPTSATFIVADPSGGDPKKVSARIVLEPRADGER